MRQFTLTTVSFDKRSKQTRSAEFLLEMDQMVPWRDLCATIELYYSVVRNGPAADRAGTHAAPSPRYHHAPRAKMLVHTFEQQLAMQLPAHRGDA